MAAIHAMKGPRKILELDGNPKSRWKLETGALHLWESKLWAWEVAGCILCAEMDNAENQTLTRQDDDGTEHYHCLHHGELEKVSYSIVRKCTVRIGTVEREFKDTEDDFLLFPSDMDPAERTKLTEAMITEAQEEARKQDWLPSDDDE
jgi:hypothetical protein